MDSLRKHKKATAAFLTFILLITFLIFPPNAKAAEDKSKANGENTTSSVFWSSKDMLGSVPPNTLILHEQYPNTFSRYSLDAPLNLKVYDKTPWWKPNVVKRVEDAANTWSLTRILTVIADFGFSLVKLMTTISIYVIQISMGAQWSSALFSLFGAIAKVIGVTLVTKNLFYLAMICLGGYLVFQGLIKRKLGTTLSETALSIALLAFTIIFITNPGKVMGGVNSGTDLIGTWILQIAVSQDSTENINSAIKDDNYVTNNNIDNQVTASTSLSDLKNAAIVQITNKLWALQVRAPWDILQFGQLDVNVNDPQKIREDGGVKIHEYEIDAILKILENNSVEIGDGVSSDKPDAQKLKEKGIAAGESWGNAILGLSAGEGELRSILVSVLGNKGTGEGKGEAVSMHNGAVEALNDGGTKIFVVLILLITTALTTFFICTIALGLFLAQLIVLIAMVVGPFVLMLSALPQFGHRYIKNWGLITLGAFGTKIIYFTLMAIMFLLISTLMTLAFDINTLGLDEQTKSQLNMFSPDGTTSLLLVQVLVILVMYGLSVFRKKMFQKNTSGTFGVAGALIHNTASGGNWGQSMSVVRESMQGQSYGQYVVGSRENRKFNKDMGFNNNRQLNKGNDADSRRDDENTYGSSADEKQGTGNESLQNNGENVQQLGQGEGNPDYTDENGADAPGAGGTSPNNKDTDDYEFNNGANASEGSGSQKENRLNCPINGATCSNESVAYGSGSSMCSVTGKVCPYRNMAETEHYSQMMQLRRQRNASNTTDSVAASNGPRRNAGSSTEGTNTPTNSGETQYPNNTRMRSVQENGEGTQQPNNTRVRSVQDGDTGIDGSGRGVVISEGTVNGVNIVGSRRNTYSDEDDHDFDDSRSSDEFLSSRGRSHNSISITGGNVNAENIFVADQATVHQDGSVSASPNRRDYTGNDEVAATRESAKPQSPARDQDKQNTSKKAKENTTDKSANKKPAGGNTEPPKPPVQRSSNKTEDKPQQSKNNSSSGKDQSPQPPRGVRVNPQSTNEGSRQTDNDFIPGDRGLGRGPGPGSSQE